MNPSPSVAGALDIANTTRSPVQRSSSRSCCEARRPALEVLERTRPGLKTTARHQVGRQQRGQDQGP